MSKHRGRCDVCHGRAVHTSTLSVRPTRPCRRVRACSLSSRLPRMLLADRATLLLASAATTASPRVARRGSTVRVSPRSRVVPGIVRVAERRPPSVALAASGEPTLPDLSSKVVQAVAPATKAAGMPTALGAVLGTAWSFPALWALAVVPCCLGSVNPVYVFSVGYGLSVAAQGAGLLAMSVASGAWLPAPLLAHLLGAVFYGARLGGFPTGGPSRGRSGATAPRTRQRPRPRASSSASLVVLTCALLYAMMCSPMLWHAQTANAVPAGSLPVVYAGLAAQWFGAILEAVADQQKSDYKFSDAGKSRWCDVGVYARCRHPNYLGELMFWLGTFVAGVPAMAASGWRACAPAARARVHHPSHDVAVQETGRETGGTLRG